MSEPTKLWNGSPMEPFDRGNPARRCVAHRKNGERCRKWAIQGGTVCATHGGAAKHVRNAARARLANAADRMARQLLKMAVDENVPDAVKLKAITEALDRGGLSTKTEVEISAKPYEQIIGDVAAGIEGGSRADFRRSQGIADDTHTALANSPRQPPPISDDLIIDGEIEDDLEPDDAITDLGEFVSDVGDYAGESSFRPWNPAEHVPEGMSDRPYDPFARSGPPPMQLMSLEDAVAEQARVHREAARWIREQSALPPGRSSIA